MGNAQRDYPGRVGNYHINHNPVDNRLGNLRLVTSAENNRNVPLRKANTSSVCGVNWHKLRCKWRAYIRTSGKHLHLGMFDNFEDAVSARKAAEVKYGFHPNHGLAEVS